MTPPVHMGIQSLIRPHRFGDRCGVNDNGLESCRSADCPKEWGFWLILHRCLPCHVTGGCGCVGCSPDSSGGGVRGQDCTGFASFPFVSWTLPLWDCGGKSHGLCPWVCPQHSPGVGVRWHGYTDALLTVAPGAVGLRVVPRTLVHCVAPVLHCVFLLQSQVKIQIQNSCLCRFWFNPMNFLSWFWFHFWIWMSVGAMVVCLLTADAGMSGNLNARWKQNDVTSRRYKWWRYVIFKHTHGRFLHLRVQDVWRQDVFFAMMTPRHSDARVTRDAHRTTQQNVPYHSPTSDPVRNEGDILTFRRSTQRDQFCVSLFWLQNTNRRHGRRRRVRRWPNSKPKPKSSLPCRIPSKKIGVTLA